MFSSKLWCSSSKLFFNQFWKSKWFNDFFLPPMQVEQLFNIGLAARDRCQRILQLTNWDIEAASRLLLEQHKQSHKWSVPVRVFRPGPCRAKVLCSSIKCHPNQNMRALPTRDRDSCPLNPDRATALPQMSCGHCRQYRAGLRGPRKRPDATVCFREPNALIIITCDRENTAAMFVYALCEAPIFADA